MSVGPDRRIQEMLEAPVIMASMLTADFAVLGDQCRAVQQAGIDGIHWDIMDGVAVPSLSFGPDVIAACRDHVTVPFEAHVMTNTPDRLIEPLARSGCEAVTIHPDWVQNPRRTLERIIKTGMKAGVALSPGTPTELARWHMDLVSTVLVMTVEPGFGGQTNITFMLEKTREVANLIKHSDRSIKIEVDGGISPETIGAAHRAGARRFVVGSALWRSSSIAAGAGELRRAITRAGADTPP